MVPYLELSVPVFDIAPDKALFISKKYIFLTRLQKHMLRHFIRVPTTYAFVGKSAKIVLLWTNEKNIYLILTFI